MVAILSVPIMSLIMSPMQGGGALLLAYTFGQRRLWGLEIPGIPFHPKLIHPDPSRRNRCIRRLAVRW